MMKQELGLLPPIVHSFAVYSNMEEKKQSFINGIWYLGVKVGG